MKLRGKLILAALVPLMVAIGVFIANTIIETTVDRYRQRGVTLAVFSKDLAALDILVLEHRSQSRERVHAQWEKLYRKGTTELESLRAEYAETDGTLVVERIAARYTALEHLDLELHTADSQYSRGVGSEESSRYFFRIENRLREEIQGMIPEADTLVEHNNRQIARLDSLKERSSTTMLLLLAALAPLWAYLLNKSVLAPVRQLSNGVTRLSGGDFDFRLDVTSGDEIGTLSELFNSMLVERGRSEHDLRMNNDLLKKLFELSQMTDKPDTVLGEAALEGAIRLSGSQFGYFMTLNDDESEMTLLSWSHNVLSQCDLPDHTFNFKTEMLALLAASVRSRTPDVVNDYAASPLPKHGYPEGHVPVFRFLSVPIIENNRVVLLCGIANKEASYDETDIRNITLIASGLWRILQKQRADSTIKTMNQSLEQRVMERTAELALKSDELIASELKYRIIADNTYDWEFWINPDGGYRYCSPSCLRVAGYDADAFYADSGLMKRIIHPDDLALYDTHMESRHHQDSAATTSLVFRICHADGSVRWIQHICQPIFYSVGRFIGTRGSNRDDTLRRVAEQALADKEQFQRLLTDNIPGMVGYWNSELRCSYANREYQIWFGKSLQEMIGIRMNELLGERLFQMNEPYIRGALAGDVQSFELAIVKPDGNEGYTWAHYIPDRFGGEVRGFFVMITDITEIKRAEIQLMTNQKRLEGLVRIAQFRTDDVQALLDVALEEALQLTGSEYGYIYNYDHEAEEFILNSWSRGVMQACTVVEPKTRYELANTGIWGEAVRQRRPIILNDFSAYHPLKKGCPEGHVTLHRFLTIPVFQNEIIVGVIGVANKESDYDQTDVLQLTLMMDIVWRIADRIRIMQELSIARDRSEAASSSKSEFLASVSHEIRTPMSGIIGLSRLALRTGLDMQQRDYVNKILYSAESLLGIINDLLDFSKIEAGKIDLEQIDFTLADVLERTADILSMKAEEKGLGLTFTIAPEIPRLLVGDPFRLHQILNNLISNAIKFTAAGGVQVAVTAVTPAAADARIRFAVCDTGIGMNGGQLEKIFSPYSQADSSTSRKYGGTGLGLSIVKRLVELKGGELQVESTPGEGSCFSFILTFPVSPRNADFAAASEENAAGGNSQLSGLRLLVAEDNSINRQIMTELLLRFGISADCAADGREAVEMVAYAAQPYAAVLMDLEMPVMDGHEATRQIRQSKSAAELPIIAVSAHVSPDEQEQCLASGMNGYVTKPIEPDELYAALLNVCTGSEQCRTEESRHDR